MFHHNNSMPEKRSMLGKKMFGSMIRTNWLLRLCKTPYYNNFPYLLMNISVNSMRNLHQKAMTTDHQRLHKRIDHSNSICLRMNTFGNTIQNRLQKMLPTGHRHQYMMHCHNSFLCLKMNIVERTNQNYCHLKLPIVHRRQYMMSCHNNSTKKMMNRMLMVECKMDMVYRNRLVKNKVMVNMLLSHM